MADHEDEDLKIALRMSMQPESPEPKMSWPGGSNRAEADGDVEVDGNSRQTTQRELMAAAAEKRMMVAGAKSTVLPAPVAAVKVDDISGGEESESGGGEVVAAAGIKLEIPVEGVVVANWGEKLSVEEAQQLSVLEMMVAGAKSTVLPAPVAAVKVDDINGGEESESGGGEVVAAAGIKLESPVEGVVVVKWGEKLSVEEAQQLFSIIFGEEVTKDIVAQWSNQGIRFSTDPETSVGLVQHAGGPCGVLATLQAFILKHLVFFPEKSAYTAPAISRDMDLRRAAQRECIASDIFSSLTEERKSRALVSSMCEILFLCGNNERAVIASIGDLPIDTRVSGDSSYDDVIAKALEGVVIESGPDLQKALRVEVHTVRDTATQRLEAMLPHFRSRMGAILFLISSLLSRGMESVQEDRDDPSQPLITSPFGHASQEIVNLLICGKAIANVFDGRIDLGGGMLVNGISSPVDVGFLTLLESLNFCQVGMYLKFPRLPIWVVGSESHYTVLFALDPRVQEENEYDRRERHIRTAFAAQDQSGGGGFISAEGFHQVLRDAAINIPAEIVEHLCDTEFILWSEFWQVLSDLDSRLGGLKDATGMMGKKVFDLYHYNGIAKSVTNLSQTTSSGVGSPIQRPRLTKLRVSVPPWWMPEEFVSGNDEAVEPFQHAPLVDCIRTRWPRATCSWDGDAPSIV